MKHIILFLFVLLALISCVKEEEDSPLLSAPVITLKEESPIYNKNWSGDNHRSHL